VLSNSSGTQDAATPAARRKLANHYTALWKNSKFIGYRANFRRAASVTALCARAIRERRQRKLNDLFCLTTKATQLENV